MLILDIYLYTFQNGNTKKYFVKGQTFVQGIPYNYLINYKI